MKQCLPIKIWAQDDRPREKLLNKGRNALSDTELLAIILGSGSRDQSAVELAQKLLFHVENDLSVFANLTVNDLMKFKGVGQAKAVGVVAALELGRRRKLTTMCPKLKVTSSKMAYDHIRIHLQGLHHEEFHVILLNRANEIICSKQISIGGFSGTVADGKVIFKTALDYSAHALILVHNHPSGQLLPSDSDKKLTQKMVEFGRYIDLPILDHIIFTDNDYFSFADKGMI
jgi:DNA repair protein RadC